MGEKYKWTKPEGDTREHFGDLNSLYPKLKCDMCDEFLVPVTEDDYSEDEGGTEVRSRHGKDLCVDVPLQECKLCKRRFMLYRPESLNPPSSAPTLRALPILGLRTQSCNASSEGGTWMNCYTLIGLCGLMVAVAAVWLSTSYFLNEDQPTTTSDADDFQKVLRMFEDSLPGMKEKFARQSNATWRSIRTAVRMTANLRKPKMPGVISLIPSGDETAAEDTVDCLAMQLALTLQKSYNDSDLLKIDGKKFGSRWSDAVKLNEDLDEQIRRNLDHDANHVVLISNLDQLPATSGMLLHGFCDNDNAPFKQAIFILTVSSRNRQRVEDVTNVDVVDEQVTIAWKSEMTEEKRQSLETRIGNNIAVVLPETKETLEQVC